MRKFIAFSLLVTLLVFRSYSFVGAQSFEGSFVMQIMDEGSISRMLFIVKSGQIIIEPIDETLPKPVRILMKKGDEHMYILTEEQGKKVAIRYSYPPLSTGDPALSDANYKATETGKTKKIGAYECRQVIVESGEGQKLEMWVTSSMGFTLSQLFESIGRFSSTVSNGDYQDVTKHNDKELYQKNMALEIIELKEGSSTQISIKDIVKKTIPDADFDLTPYAVIDMNQMMGK